ncbi:hypothetical protein AGMMS50293_23130 [Spirochaetia bacterium]|nr:hypothetical protein AGMMS50293_23130 [Spirochaetia bacterium]
MKVMRGVRVFILAMGAAALLGCVSLVETTGRALDGSAFEEKKVAVYRGLRKKGAATDIEIREMVNKAGERAVIVALGDYPYMKLRGSAPDHEGNFYLTSLEYLGGSVSGWNEYSLELSGAGRLLLGENEAVLSIPFAPEPVRIAKARIHRFDTRITGNDALANLNNRRERIAALTEWMNARQETPRPASRKDFEKYWKPILFPEMVSKKKRPPLWQQEGDAFVKAEDIRWNTGYTGRVFPEELRTVRNSGTMLRDWEEALSWIYLEYDWEKITGLLSREITVPRKK